MYRVPVEPMALLSPKVAVVVELIKSQYPTLGCSDTAPLVLRVEEVRLFKCLAEFLYGITL